MGRAKNEQIEREAKIQQAIDLCIDIGAVEECQLHEGEYIDSMEYQDYEELTEVILQENSEALNIFKDREEMVDCVRDAMQSTGDECGYCAKNRDS